MSTIRAYTGYLRYRDFEIIEELPDIGDKFHGGIVTDYNAVGLDCEQPKDAVYDYHYFKINTIWEDSDGIKDTETHYVAIRKEEECERELWYVFDNCGNIVNENDGIEDEDEAIEYFKEHYSEEDAREFGFTLCLVVENGEGWSQCLEELDPEEIFD